MAVISNASLLWQADIRAQLLQADAVSLKVDAVEEIAWRRINRPHGRLKLEQVLQGVRDFARQFKGRLLTETMLVKDVNTSPEHVRACAKFIAGLKPEMAYLALPLRSPAEDWVEAPEKQEIARVQQVFAEHFSRSALMTDLPETGLVASDDPLQALLNTIKVHPMEETEVHAYMRENHIAVESLEELVRGNQIQASDHRGKTFYSIRYEPKHRN